MTPDLRPASDAETADYLAGYTSRPGSVETEHGLMVPVAEVVACAWFLLCDRDATGTVPHPVLGNVPACARCSARASA